MKATLLTLVLLLCLVFCAGAQQKPDAGTLKGQVSAEGKPIPGATVALWQEGSSSALRQTATDSSGIYFFSSLAGGSYHIKVSQVGLSTFNSPLLTLKAGEQRTLPGIVLTASNRNLKEVVVQAPPKALVEQQLDRTMVNVGALLSNTGVSAVEVLTNSPGVDITENSISLRNKAGVSVYVDGRQVMLSGQDLVAYLRSLPSALLDKVELMPNPPARYHAEGGGVINIITKKNKAKGLSGNASIGATQASYFNSDDNLNLAYKLDKVNIYFTAAYRKNILDYHVAQQRDYTPSGLTLAQNNAEVDHTESYRGRLGFDYDPDARNSFGLLVDGFTGPYREQGDYVLQFRNSAVDSVIKTRSALNRAARNGGANLNYRHRFVQKDTYFSVNLDLLSYNDHAVQQVRSGTFLPAGTMPVSTYALGTDNPFQANFYSLKMDQEALLAGVKLSTGVQGTYSLRNSKGIYTDGQGQQLSASNSQEGSEKTGAAYLSLNRQLGRFSLQAGLRYENTRAASNIFSINYGNLLPSFYLSYQLDTVAKTALLFSFNTRVDRPGYAALDPFVFYFDQYSSISGNPALQPSRSSNFELSYNTGLHLTIGGRINIASDPIIQFFELNGRSINNTNINIGSSGYTGLFTNWSVTPLKSWSINGYEEVFRQQFSGASPGGEPFDHRLISYRLQLNNQVKFQSGWSAELSGYYTSRNTFGQGETLPYGRANASLQKKIFNGKGAVVFSTLDMFHTNVIRREIELNSAEFERRNSYDSRRFSLTLTYNFGAGYQKQVVNSGLGSERSRVGAN